MKFSFNINTHRNNLLLNICDDYLLGKNITDDGVDINITSTYYGGNALIEKYSAIDLLKKYNIINMVGRNIVALSIKLGIGSKQGTKKIGGIPFLIIFKM